MGADNVIAKERSADSPRDLLVVASLGVGIFVPKQVGQVLGPGN